MLGQKVFDNEFQKRDYNNFLREFEAANKSGVRLRMNDQIQVGNWRGGIMGLLIPSGRLQQVVDFFMNHHAECKMAIIDDVSPNYNGLWLYTIDATEEGAWHTVIRIHAVMYLFQLAETPASLNNADKFWV